MSETPARIGHYEVLRRLGAGGMGEVFLARDTRLEREVAIKRLPPEFARDAGRLERFRREALALASLNHPGIATLYGIEPVPDGGLALVMEFVPGETLADRLARGPLAVEEALVVGAQIAEAVEAAHAREVVHRDLKPANVTFAAASRVKVLDFGLARRGRSAAPEAADAEGTPGYMSPEQAMGTPQDERTDLFAFGCVLFECLAGAPAFPGDDPWTRIAATMHGEPDFTQVPARAPASVRELLARLLAKDPAVRPASMREARLVLEDAAGLRRASALLHGETASAMPHHLPAAPTAFVGRERELAAAGEALARTSLLTLTGVGGCGKSRLALALAQQRLLDYPDGAWAVELAPVSDPERVAERVAEVLGVREESERPVEHTLAAWFATRRLLLLLDNCEHLLGAVAELVGPWIESAPGLRVLATSREGLGLPGEQLMAVPSLSLPPAREAPDAEALARYDAVRLFVERARAVRPEFALDAGSAPVVADICRRLDGIPLAIELAAARIKVLAPEQIAARLDDRFRLLTGGSRTAMPRHQTLRATLQWSHDLLHEPERQLLRRLAAFKGGWTLEQAVRVFADDADEFEVLDLLTHLVDKSLVTADRAASAEVRYGFLETVRQFAVERLDESGDGPAARARHLACFLALAEGTEAVLNGPLQARHFARLDLERENLFGALDWCDQAEGGAESGLRLAVALWRWWNVRGQHDVARRAFTLALARPCDDEATPLRATALIRLGAAELVCGHFAAARHAIEHSLAIARLHHETGGIARALSGLSVVALFQEDYATARACTVESLAIYRERGQPRGVALALHNLGTIEWCEGRDADADARLREALAAMEALGDQQHVALTLAALASVETRTGRLADSAARLDRALALVQELRAEREAAEALEAAAELADRAGRTAAAAATLEAARTLRERIGAVRMPVQEAQCEAFLVRAAHALGDAALRAETARGAATDLDGAIALARSAIAQIGRPTEE